jgi:Ca2+/Na+ antiporter
MEKSERETVLFRTLLIFTMIVVAAALRLAPHPWNFTPVGAIALFAGATVRDRRLAFLFPLLVMLATDLIIGFNKLSPLVYASFVLSVLIGRVVIGVRFSATQPERESARSERANPTPQKRAVPRIAAATFLGALQFFLITNFGVWAFLSSYPRTGAGLATCYLAGIPLFWNTLAGDATYVTLLFGGLLLAERFAPQLRQAALPDR